MTIPLDPDAFPHALKLYPATTYTRGRTGAATAVDGAAVDCPGNVQLASDDLSRRDDPGRERSTASTTLYDVSLPGPGMATDEQLAAIAALGTDDAIEAAEGNPFPLRGLCEAPAAPVFGGGWYRVRVRVQS